MDAQDRYQKVRRITLFGAGKNAFLAVFKIIFGIMGHSHALFADGIHSLSDLLIDGVVLVASRFGSKAADSDHPYGHGRIETAATLLLALILSLAGIGIIWDASLEVFGLRAAVRPDLDVLVVALVSILANEVLYFYTRRVGEQVQSNLLISNAWHHRSDSASSLVVLIGVAAAIFGFARLDGLAAIVVGLMIIKMAWEFGWNSIRELVDTGLDDAVLDQIKASISKVPGVREVHQLRTRSIAGKIFLDVHILVDPMISVSEGHFIGQQVYFQLSQDVAGIADVTVHVDPEDDEIIAPIKNLPGREQIINLLNERWQGLVPPEVIQAITLHYLANKVYIELKLPFTRLAPDTEVPQLHNQLQQAIAAHPHIAGVEILFQ